MNAIGKALWYIESHFAEIQSLEEVATRAGVTPFHLTRAFSIATGFPVMRYVRGRRLAEAARVLAAGAPNILSVALEAGYGSHEAFSRAFREHFGLTPESVRDRRTVDNLKLMEPLNMNANPPKKIDPVRYEDGPLLLLAGLGQRYAFEPRDGMPTRAAIPNQWQKFGPYLGRIPGQIGRTAYGVCSNFDDEATFDYLCGVEVKSFSGLDRELTLLRVPAQRYAVFAHRDHVSSVADTWNSIMAGWLPESGYEGIDAPQFEKYGEAFAPVTGQGGFEIWIPVRKK